MSKIFNVSVLLFILISFVLTGCDNHSENTVDWKPTDGYISNKESAIKVAEVVWLNVYGAEIEDNKPFKVRLKDGEIWIVEGTFNNTGFGGVPYIEIRKSDGQILKVIHGR